MIEWSSSWLVEQVVRGSSPGLVTLISEIWYLLLQSRDMTERLLNLRKIPKHSNHGYIFKMFCRSTRNFVLVYDVRRLRLRFRTSRNFIIASLSSLKKRRLQVDESISERMAPIIDGF